MQFFFSSKNAVSTAMDKLIVYNLIIVYSENIWKKLCILMEKQVAR